MLWCSLVLFLIGDKWELDLLIPLCTIETGAISRCFKESNSVCCGGETENAVCHWSVIGLCNDQDSVSNSIPFVHCSVTKRPDSFDDANRALRPDGTSCVTACILRWPRRIFGAPELEEEIDAWILLLDTLSRYANTHFFGCDIAEWLGWCLTIVTYSDYSIQ